MITRREVLIGTAAGLAAPSILVSRSIAADAGASDTQPALGNSGKAAAQALPVFGRSEVRLRRRNNERPRLRAGGRDCQTGLAAASGEGAMPGDPGNNFAGSQKSSGVFVAA